MQELQDVVVFHCLVNTSLLLFGTMGKTLSSKGKRSIASPVFPVVKSTLAAEISIGQLLCHHFCLQEQSSAAAL